MTIVHTSEREAGQIYIPEVNTALMVGCLTLVLTFKTAGALAAAYRIAVTGTMVITTRRFAVVARGRWGWPRLLIVTHLLGRERRAGEDLPLSDRERMTVRHLALHHVPHIAYVHRHAFPLARFPRVREPGRMSHLVKERGPICG